MSKEAAYGKSAPALIERVPAVDTSSSVYVMWGFFALASFVAAVAICFTPGADRRFAAAISLPAEARPSAPMIAQLESRPLPDFAQKTADDELVTRLRSLEQQIDLLTTGTVPAQNSEPAAAEPSKTSLPDVTPSTSETAAAPAPTVAPRLADPATSQTTFGIDLGADTSFGALRSRWDGLRRQYPELARLSPRVAARDKNGRVELRLIAGPFENAADAARACAGLLAKGTLCDGSLFDGQRLPAS